MARQLKAHFIENMKMCLTTGQPWTFVLKTVTQGTKKTNMARIEYEDASYF